MGLEIFSERIKELRVRSGLTVRMLAEELEISHSSIVYYEGCKREPTLTVLKAYAKRFNVSVDYLIGLEDKANGKNQKP